MARTSSTESASAARLTQFGTPARINASVSVASSSSIIRFVSPVLLIPKLREATVYATKDLRPKAISVCVLL